MKRAGLYILVVTVLVSGLCSCNRSKGIIPRAKFSKIYAELFLADAWLSSASPDARVKADTTAFYEPVFKKYGFTTADYLTSVEYYLNDPERFGKIIKKAHHMLDMEVEQMESKKGVLREQVELATDDAEPEDALSPQDDSLKTKEMRRRVRKKSQKTEEEEPDL